MLLQIILAALLLIVASPDPAKAQCSGQFGATQFCGSAAGGLPGPVTYAPSATTDTTNASNISSGTLPVGRLPAFTGDCSSSAASSVLTCDIPTVQLEDYGNCLPSSGLDCTPALNAAVAAMTNVTTRMIIRFNSGAYKFVSKPNDFTVGVTLWCPAGMSQTTLDRFYSAGSTTEGFLTWSGAGANGGGIDGCTVSSDNGFTNGTMLKFVTASGPAGFGFVRDTNVSRSGTGDYVNALLVDGSANTTPGSQGYRDLVILRSFFFHGSVATESVRLINVVNTMATLVWTQGEVVITGSGSATGNSTNVNWNSTTISQVFVSNSTLVNLSGQFDSLIFSTGSSNSCSAAYVPVGNYSDTGTNNYQGGCAPFVGATGAVAGYPGIVPAPAATDNLSVLVGDRTWRTVGAAIDNGIGSVRGSILERGSSGWAIIGPGASGLPFVSNGAGADPSYQTLPVAGGGTGATTASGARSNLSAAVSGANGDITSLTNATGVPLHGTNTNDSASAGFLGEYISSTVLAGSAVSLTDSTPANVTSISLTAGDWDVCGNIATAQVGGPTTTALVGWISTTSASLPTAPNAGAEVIWRGSTTSTLIQPVGCTRQSLSGTTTVYLSIEAFFTGGTSLSGYGFIGARRAR